MANENANPAPASPPVIAEPVQAAPQAVAAQTDTPAANPPKTKRTAAYSDADILAYQQRTGGSRKSAIQWLRRQAKVQAHAQAKAAKQAASKPKRAAKAASKPARKPKGKSKPKAEAHAASSYNPNHLIPLADRPGVVKRMFAKHKPSAIAAALGFGAGNGTGYVKRTAIALGLRKAGR